VARRLTALQIYGHGTKGTQGSQPYKDLSRYGNSQNGAPSLLIAPDEDHSRQRKIFTPAFSDRALKQQEPLFLKYINKLVSVMRETVKEDLDKKFDLIRLFNFTTFDVMGDLTFGEPLHMLNNAEYDPWVKSIFSGLKMVSHLSLLRFYPWLWKLFVRLAPASANRKQSKHFNYSVTRVTKRLEKGRNSEGVDLWDLVLRQKEGRGLTRAEMDSNAALFMIAGTETTSTLVSGLTYLLLRNPECLKKLNKEIRTEFKNADEMTMERLAALPYLAACIKEAFRIYPPVPLILPRRTPGNGTTICGHFIPPNTAVGIPHHVMYMSERNFKRPTEFLPQRWLGDSEFESDQKQCLQPFSVGSKDCLGKK
jgi:cytochrome P450